MLYDHLSVSPEGHLLIDGADTVRLAEEYGTPLYVLSEDRIRRNCRIYTEAVRKYFPAGSAVLFAGKALCFKGIYPIIESEGLSADVVSAGEIFTALSAGFPAEKMYFHGSCKTDEEIRFGLDHQVGTFVVDNFAELNVLDEEAGKRGVVQDILLRVTVGLDPHTLDQINTGKVDSQFGTPIETGAAMAILEAALMKPHLNVLGFHSHIGSQIFDFKPFTDQVDILLAFAAEVRKKTGFAPQVLNLGGGFGVPYTENDPKVDIEANIAGIAASFNEGAAKYGLTPPRILMEPGRSIVADAGITLYTAGGVKNIEGYRSYVMVDGGMTDNPRYALYKSAYTVLSAARMNEKAEFECTVAGRCCESGDRIQENVLLPEPVRGDVIAVLTTGAYNYSMASNYNRIPRPALVILKDGKPRLAVRRETFEDLVQREI
ncbi:MAG: diaminopimelate decarboxylase [Lachnospiraceae bacterium]|nr:diaminopimelate decarboxylase [Lachnospiraceae bacterium]